MYMYMYVYIIIIILRLVWFIMKIRVVDAPSRGILRRGSRTRELVLRQGSSDNGPLATRQKRIRSTKQLRSTAAHRVDIHSPQAWWHCRRSSGLLKKIANSSDQRVSVTTRIQILIPKKPHKTFKWRIQERPMDVHLLVGKMLVEVVVVGCRLWRFCEVLVLEEAGSLTRPWSAPLRCCPAKPAPCALNPQLGRCLASRERPPAG